jgi:hypothetical protein
MDKINEFLIPLRPHSELELQLLHGNGFATAAGRRGNARPWVR